MTGEQLEAVSGGATTGFGVRTDQRITLQQQLTTAYARSNPTDYRGVLWLMQRPAARLVSCCNACSVLGCRALNPIQSRGRVCDRRRSFGNFYANAGRQPNTESADARRSDRAFEPGDAR
jgi:hypothetical protein